MLITTEFAVAAMTTSQIAKKYSSSVVTIIALDDNDQPLSLGSGFFINNEGDIATNHHVLEGCSKAIIKTTKGERGVILEILKDDPDLDLLVASTSLKHTKPLPLGDSDTITVGEDIIAVGNPAGLEGTISTGIISGIRKIENFKLIQITSPISPGSSGGPVFNKTGQVIGVATAYLDYGQSLNFAMPINSLKTLKEIKLKLASLPKAKLKNKIPKDESLVKAFDVHLNFGAYDECNSNELSSLDFAIKNLSNYSISNITLFFVYKNHKGEVVSYSSTKVKNSILPKLALQFNHRHYVKYFRKCRKCDTKFKICKYGDIDIRILDYKIDRTSARSPSDLLFK